MKSIGKFSLFLLAMFYNRLKWRIYLQKWTEECVDIGFRSIFIIAVVSLFMGAVTCIQISHNLFSPLAGKFLLGFGVRNMIILELSPTVMALIFAGKIGSNITSQLGSMRITEQIDAIEIMGINASTYLVLPKIIASICMYPLLVILSGCLAIFSGYLVAKFVLPISAEEYLYGIRYLFDPYTIKFAIYKSVTFAFLVSAIAGYKGFYVLGGAVAVGKASTEAVTNSCIAILAADYVLTQLLL
jgi:phospholipid/cholesterol/gamma-HCH transport system permease protein